MVCVCTCACMHVQAYAQTCTCRGLCRAQRVKLSEVSLLCPVWIWELNLGHWAYIAASLLAELSCWPFFLKFLMWQISNSSLRLQSLTAYKDPETKNSNTWALFFLFLVIFFCSLLELILKYSFNFFSEHLNKNLDFLLLLGTC